jgi:CO/xanthine dehydrogenase Mo-binding subunit
MTGASVLLCGAKKTFASLPVRATTRVISIIEVSSREALGVPIGMVDVVNGVTGKIPFGMGTYASRSLALGGSALVMAIDKW